VAHEAVLRPLEQRIGAADLHRAAAGHHHHLVGKGQRFHLVVRDVDQGQLQLVVDLLELAPQLPLQVRVDHGQRLVEQHGAHVFTHQAAAQADLLLGVGGQAGGALVELAGQFQHLGDAAHAFADARGGHAAVLQRKGQVLAHRHGVVDDRELEHLRDVALLRCLPRDVGGPELHAALRRLQQPRDDVQQRGLAAAAGAQQRVGAAVVERHLQRQQRVVGVDLGVGLVRMRQVQRDAGHGGQLRVLPGATSRSPRASKT
jgi:hypothetical protein